MLVASLLVGCGLSVLGQSGEMTAEEQTLWLGFVIFYLIFWAVLFHKAGRAWWLAFIPFVNIYVFFDMLGWHWTGFILLLVPFVNIVAYFAVSIYIAKSFGKTEMYGFILAFFWPIMIPILALGRAEYVPPELRSDHEPMRHVF